MGSERLAFEDFLLEPSRHRLLHRDGRPVTLTPRLFRALVLFVEHPGELLDKDTLIQALWPGLVVEENNLSQVISGLRRALGDDSHGSRFIQTVPRRGFRFIAPVESLTDAEVESSTAPTASEASASALAEPGRQPPARSDEVAISSALPSPLRTIGRRPWLGGALAAGLGGMAWWAWPRRAGVPAVAGPPTLAVLPFKPLQADARDPLLEVGMADSLIARLSAVPGLVVRSTGSVARYAGSDQDLQRAARELDVAWIVDGSLQRRDDQLRVTARLLRTSDGTAAWSGSFDTKFTSVFDVQDQISKRVNEALLPILSASTTPSTATIAPAEVGGTRSVEAYRLYLAASAEMQFQRADGLRKSIALFNQALDIDPAYALAWTGLADAQRRLSFVGDVSPTVAFANVDVALRRALAIAPNLGEAHATLGAKLYAFDFDWEGAEREFRRTIAINPNVALAHLSLGQLLVTQDRIAEGFIQLRTARELSPLEPLFNVLEASFLLVGGRLEEGRARLTRTFEIAPKMPLAHLVKAQLLFSEQQTDQGIASLRQAVGLAGGATVFDALLGYYLARTGQSDEAREILDRLHDRAGRGYVAATALATVHAGLGEGDAAMVALEQAYEQRDARLVFIKDAPYWSGLRGEPRFQALMTKLGLDRFGPGVWNP